jgi:hypothetical protein
LLPFPHYPQASLYATQALADTLAACCKSLTSYVQRIWSKRTQVPVPGYLRPPSVRVRVIDIKEETERQRKAHAYCSSVVHESVLLQYSVDTLLDQTLQQLFEACLRCSEPPVANMNRADDWLLHARWSKHSVCVCVWQDICAMRVLKGNPLHAAIARVKVASQRFETHLIWLTLRAL